MKETGDQMRQFELQKEDGFPTVEMKHYERKS